MRQSRRYRPLHFPRRGRRGGGRRIWCEYEVSRVELPICICASFLCILLFSSIVHCCVVTIKITKPTIIFSIFASLYLYLIEQESERWSRVRTGPSIDHSRAQQTTTSTITGPVYAVGFCPSLRYRYRSYWCVTCRN